MGWILHLGNFHKGLHLQLNIISYIRGERKGNLIVPILVLLTGARCRLFQEKSANLTNFHAILSFFVYHVFIVLFIWEMMVCVHL